MSIIRWGVDFYTGLPDIDRQHNQLVALVNRLSESSGGPQEILEQAFRELHDYALEHFTLEEHLMEEAGIDADHITYHKNAHALFVAKLGELWTARGGDSGQTLEDLLVFLTTWILQHLLQTDRKMALEVHAKLGTDAPHNMFAHF